MKFSIALLIGFAATSSTATTIKVNSRVGSKLLSSARRLNGDGDLSWATNYSLRFEKCATTNDYYGGYFGGNGDQGGGNDREGFMYQQRLVHFKLCPTDTCGSGCSGGADYVIDMNEFVSAYLEYKEELKEQQCEDIRENCYCNNDDEDACLYQCYTQANLYEQCADKDGNNGNNNEEEFDIQEATECARLDIDEEAAAAYAYNNNGGQNQNNYYQNQNQNQQQDVEFFVGPTCSSNGKSIHLKVFMDETCSYSAPDGVYERFHYGKSLPYASTSIIEHDCISCKEPEENNGNNNNNNNNNNQEEAGVLEVCEQLYETAGKCETNLQAYGMYPNTMACQFIAGLNPWGKTRIKATFSQAAENLKTPKVLAGVFAATTVVFGGVAYYLNNKLKRQSVGLVYDGQNMA